MDNDRTDASRRRREQIELKLRDVYQQAQAADNTQALRKVSESMHQILEMLKARAKPMLREDHDACWNRWVEIKELMENRRRELCVSNYDKFKSAAHEARELADKNAPREAKAKVREIQRDMKGQPMERSQFDEIRALLDETYKTAGVLQEAKHAEWRTRLEEARSRKVALLEKNQMMISNLEQQIDRCRDMLRTANSSEFVSRVEGWIEEKYDKIQDIERFKSALDDQVRDIDAKLNE